MKFRIPSRYLYYEEECQRRPFSVYARTETKGLEEGYERPLSVSVHIHLDDSVGNGLLDLSLGRTGSSVEDQEPETRNESGESRDT
jgi:hypothetical protein